MVIKWIAVQDRNQHNQPVYAYSICKIFVLCHLLSGQFIDNIETTEIQYFDRDDLPSSLSSWKNNKRTDWNVFSSISWFQLADTIWLIKKGHKNGYYRS